MRLPALLIPFVLAACSTAPEFDVVIDGGSIVDGTGAAPRRADVGIKGDRIVSIGNLADRASSNRIDAAGRTVAPGFIDIMGGSGVSLLANGVAASRLRQGITTELLADRSLAFWTSATADPDALRVAGVTFDWSGLNGYFNKLSSRGTAINVGTLAPLSLATGGRANFVDAAIRDGAWGVVDDAPLSREDLEPVAAAVARANAALMLPADSAGIVDDTSFDVIGNLARRLVISDLSRIQPGPSIAQLNGRIARATQRSIAVYGTVVPSSESLAGSSIPDALRYGGIMIATNNEAPGNARSNVAAAFGAFPRLIGQMVREDHLMELREAIRRSTSLPATVFGIAQRGIIRENYFADVVIFDATTIADRASVDKPNQYPAGIEYVIVNGVVTVTPKGMTGARPGYGLLRNKGRR